MKLCPICSNSYPREHRTCPTHGAVLVETQELPPGTMIRDCYRIVRMLGKGGMGTVYLTEHTLMGEPRALKFLSAELASNPSFVQRFLQEARAAHKLSHVNVAQTMEVGQTEDGSFYISMEFVDGPSLRSALNQSPGGMALDRAFRIVRGVAEGLGAAHAKHMVHRDVKPENILLAQTAEGEVPKVVDFGIVAMSDGAARLTQTGSVLLTCEYAAPEQWRGTIPSSELDGRTDLYSVGCMFFEMLTGRLPYKADSYEGWFQLHVNTEPPLPSTLRPELASYPGLDAVVLRLLAKEREYRPANVVEFLAQLDQALAGKTSGVYHSAQEPQWSKTVVEVPRQSGSGAERGATSAQGQVSNSGSMPGQALGWTPASTPNPAVYPPAGSTAGLPPGPGHTTWQGATPQTGSSQAAMPAYSAGTMQPPGAQGWGNTAPPQMGWAGQPQGQPQTQPFPQAQAPAQNSGPYPAQQAVANPGQARKKSPVIWILLGVLAVGIVAAGAVWAAMMFVAKNKDGSAQQAAQSPAPAAGPSQTQNVVASQPAPPANAPAASTPETTKPDTTKPEPIKPDTTRPDTTKADTPKPVGKPAVDVAATAKQGLSLYHDKQYAQAQPLLMQACSRGDTASCNSLGYIYQDKLNGEQDYSRAMGLFTKACKGGYMLGCNNLANMYEHKLGVEQDYKQAMVYYQKACSGGEPIACNNLGILYQKGEGADADPVRAAGLYKQACDGGSGVGCSDLGYLYKNGKGVAQDSAKARTYLEKGCVMGNQFGCLQLKSLN